LRGAGGGSEVEDVIDGAGVEGIADVALLEGEGGLVAEVGQVFEVAGGEVVDAEDGVAVGEEAIDEVRAEEAGGAGDEDA
jgi:hypothetical protein